MKLIAISLVTSFILITNGFKLGPYVVKKCPSLLSFDQYLQTTFLDLDGNSDEDLKACLLKNVQNQSIILINGPNTYNNVLLQEYKVTEIANIIIMMKNITPDVFDSPSLKRVLRRSHSSLLYIIVTNNKRFKCFDGVMNLTDYSLVESFMNKIWHKYQIMRVGVTFPFACKDKMVIYRGKRYSNNILYNRTITLGDSTNYTSEVMRHNGNLLTEEYPLRANIFFRFPTSISDCRNLHYYTKINLNLTEGYCGLDALVMHDIVKHFKFNLHFPKNDNCYKYGYMTENNITGSLGCIVRKELDISFNSRFVTKYSEDYIYFLHYVTVNSLCAAVKRAEVIPIELYPISAYSPHVWYVILSLTVAIGMLTWGVATVTGKIVLKKKESLYFYIKDAFTTLMFGFTLKKHGQLYLLRGTCLCGSILFAAMYQGRINHMFTNLLRFDSIKTLDALYNSELTLHLNPSIKNIMYQLRNPENAKQNDFFRHSHLIHENYSLDFLLVHPKSVLIGRDQDVITEILSQYTDEHEQPLIHIVDECFYTFYLSYITRAGFPFYEDMQRFMQRLGEAGLPFIYQKWTCDMLGIPYITMPKNRNEARAFTKIRLEHQQVPFTILILGYITSLIVFFIEIIKGRR